MQIKTKIIGIAVGLFILIVVTIIVLIGQFSSNATAKTNSVANLNSGATFEMTQEMNNQEKPVFNSIEFLGNNWVQVRINDATSSIYRAKTDQVSDQAMQFKNPHDSLDYQITILSVNNSEEVAQIQVVGLNEIRPFHQIMNMRR